MNPSENTETRTIYHITSEYEWLASIEQGWYAAPSLSDEGFIHCSYEDQVTDTAARYYAGEHGLVLLAIDPSRLTSLCVAEKSTDDHFFPHVRGRINLEAVKGVAEFEPGPDGRFTFPKELQS